MKPIALMGNINSDNFHTLPSVKAAAAMIAAREQGKGQEMADLLFKNQPLFSDKALVEYAKELDLDLVAFNKQRVARDVLSAVKENQNEAIENSISMTPTFFIEDLKLEGYRDYDELNLYVNALLSGEEPGDDITSKETSSGSLRFQDLIYPVGELQARTTKDILKIGDQAPDFSLPSVGGDTITLSQYKGKKNVILTFVPAAFTPVCSGQWPHYANHIETIKKLNTVILGITTDNIPSQYAWTKAMGLTAFPVLSDFWPHGEVAKKYGILRPESGTTERADFVIDRNGIIRYIHVHDINSEPNLEEVLDVLKSLIEKK
jgi:peroxiredoxin (alkyl hydroperoxide reductase subunit C)